MSGNDAHRRSRPSLATGLWLVFGLTSAVLAQADKKDAPSPVTLAEVLHETLRQEVRLSGTSIPWRHVRLSPRVEGLATRVLVDVGAWVAGADARRRDAMRKRDELMRLQKNRHTSETAIESAIADLAIATADLTREQAELARARELRERHAVAAPFAGMVVSKDVEVGQWVQRDDTLIELVEMDTLRVQASLPQRYYPSVAVGARARVEFDALPEREFNGRIFARVALGNEASRSFPLLIDIDNRDHQLAPGMSARVGIELDNGTTAAMTVPRDAVVAKSSGERVVWRVRQDRDELKVYPVSVEPGRAHGDRLEVISTELQAGDRIVMLGNERLRPGQAVRDRTAGPTTVANE